MSSHRRFGAALAAMVLAFAASQASAQTGKTVEEPKAFTNSIGMKLLPIRPGEFTMGDKRYNATPHPVRITKAFHMGATLVTQAQFRKVMGENPSEFKGDEASLPVERVTWHEARQFCEKLSADAEEKRAGRTYRLPTEAEWEYCCRAGTKTSFWYGDKPDPAKMNCDESRIDKTTPVDKYPANPWGLHDMHGNLSQWCADGYGHDFYETSPKDDPFKENGNLRVRRGGSWGDWSRGCSAAYRNDDCAGPEGRYEFIGFRVVCIAAPRP